MPVNSQQISQGPELPKEGTARLQGGYEIDSGKIAPHSLVPIMPYGLPKLHRKSSEIVHLYQKLFGNRECRASRLAKCPYKWSARRVIWLQALGIDVPRCTQRCGWGQQARQSNVNLFRSLVLRSARIVYSSIYVQH